MSHYDERPKDRMVTDEHPGYDARAHWCGEDAASRAYAASVPIVFYSDWRTSDVSSIAEAERDDDALCDACRTQSSPNLRRVRAWAQAAWRIVTLLALIVLAFAAGVYAESAVWR